MNLTEAIFNDLDGFLRFLKSKYPLYHNSNIFFRDFHYGIMSYLNQRGIKIKYNKAEKIARTVAEEFSKRGIMKPVNHNTWMLNYPEFYLVRNNK